MLVARVLALLPLGLALGLPVGFFKERTSKRSLLRWVLHLAPLALLPLVR